MSAPGQLSAQAQLTENLSVAAQYFLEWESTRAPESGTYLASAGVALEGPDRMPLFTGVARPINDPVTPRNRSNWGGMGTYSLDFLHSDLSLFYRRFDDYNPWGLQVGSDFARYVYARDVRLYGLGWSVGPV
ncbi:DUF1302 family protein [Pseudomonas citronellolis]|uniref:DUF1302 family protein n=1 Tax=Pseudomonas citronellolis TaxID=53408 RepID=UPI003899E13C